LNYQCVVNITLRNLINETGNEPEESYHNRDKGIVDQYLTLKQLVATNLPGGCYILLLALLNVSLREVSIPHSSRDGWLEVVGGGTHPVHHFLTLLEVATTAVVSLLMLSNVISKNNISDRIRIKMPRLVILC